MKNSTFTEQFLYAAWNYSREDIEAGLRANDDLYDHFKDKLKSQQSRHGGSHGLLNFLFELGSERKQKFIQAFTWSYLKRQVRYLVTKDMIEQMSYGDEIPLNYGFSIYHYAEEDIIVIDHEDQDEHIFQVMIAEDDSILFEQL